MICEHMSNRLFPVCALLLVILVLTTGCGKKEGAKVTTQVAARVNGDEITVHQVNYVLSRSQNVAPEVAAQAKREILDRLIDQNLARQKAIASGLDRSPNVVQAIEAARSEILARTYLDQVTANLRRPSTEETRDYYEKHSELFAQRRVFSLEELVFTTKDDVAVELRGQLSRARTMQEIADWLQSRGVKIAASRGVRAAEQIPLEILPKLQAMKEGQVQLFDAGGGRYQVVRVVAFKAAPVDEATAAPRIQQFLLNSRSREAIVEEMKRIRNEAKIEYVGEFASVASAKEPKVKSKADAKAKAEDVAKPRAFKYSWEVEAQPGKSAGLPEEPSPK